MGEVQFKLQRGTVHTDRDAQCIVVTYRVWDGKIGFPPELEKRVLELRASGLRPEDAAAKLREEFGDQHPRAFAADAGPADDGEPVVELRIPWAILDEAEKLISGEPMLPTQREANVRAILPPKTCFTFASRA